MLLRSGHNPTMPCADSSAGIPGSTPHRLDAAQSYPGSQITRPALASAPSPALAHARGSDLPALWNLQGFAQARTARRLPAAARLGKRPQRMKIKTNKAIAKPVKPIA